MIRPPRRKVLIQQAQQLAMELSRFQTPRSGEPVDPGRLGEVGRFLQTHPDSAALMSFLKLMPDSYMKEMSQSARPQLVEISRVMTPMLRDMTDEEERSYLLGWTRRLLSQGEIQGTSDPQSERSGGSARRGPGGPRGAR